MDTHAEHQDALDQLFAQIEQGIIDTEFHEVFELVIQYENKYYPLGHSTKFALLMKHYQSSTAT